MSTRIDPRAGMPAQAGDLVDIGRLLDAYSQTKPDPQDPAQRVSFGTSGHRGSSLDGSFNEDHILAITQAICTYRSGQGIDGPLFIGIDTHALSAPAQETAFEVLAANGVDVRRSQGGEYTPTPAISHAILCHNRGRTSGLADGIVITPSHNPPADGGFKYNPPNGGPADTGVTGWVQDRANRLLASGLKDVRRVATDGGAKSARDHDYLTAYVADLGNVIDFDLIRSAGLRLGVDPLGGAGVHYWARIAEHYRIDLDVVSEQVDPQFGFMTLDWDGRIRMDPSSSYAMRRLIGMKDRYDIAFACDTDHDRHGIVTPSAGLLPTNHYLSVAIDYLFRHRPQWSAQAAIGKTVVSSAMIDRVAAGLGRPLCEVPVGFKWFVDGLFDGSLGFGGEESAGAAFLRRDGGVWTTDKDGIAPSLLAAEITARSGHDPGVAYQQLCERYGEAWSDRVEAPASKPQKQALARLSPAQITQTQLAGESMESVLDKAPGNDAPIGGIKVTAKSGWFAARPSGTEDIYKIYAESFRDEAHLHRLLQEAQSIVDVALAGAGSVPVGAVP
ncbi:phosphoglucomutase [Lysobacter concretionis Ko07 = DSM 16239]|uniref:Phosphoglucomutase n=1 Tax=Lysobacter concretionis Ko07 = DSM 16239 TaxID=1122185 RepID=A0A0A0EN09_9GAMM|nr:MULTISPECIES: phosphoglucomutase (alpha-D-glucose-1,6-bisphosphate-dependent) [Lysobacter]KGM51660.1 phosphoglucomutase [Lysobacter concretionis Ko07 = DSM 16239]QOD92278.1 alpha-D-glucose phosphate-specific phosphoglucomutase [Lysobacter sp. CW239]